MPLRTSDKEKEEKEAAAAASPPPGPQWKDPAGSIKGHVILHHRTRLPPHTLPPCDVTALGPSWSQSGSAAPSTTPPSSLHTLLLCPEHRAQACVLPLKGTAHNIFGKSFVNENNNNKNKNQQKGKAPSIRAGGGITHCWGFPEMILIILISIYSINLLIVFLFFLFFSLFT